MWIGFKSDNRINKAGFWLYVQPIFGKGNFLFFVFVLFCFVLLCFLFVLFCLFVCLFCFFGFLFCFVCLFVCFLLVGG